MSKLEHGYIMPGNSCPYTTECGDFQNLACNGTGCPVREGKTHTVKFSCAMARGFDLCDKRVSKK